MTIWSEGSALTGFVDISLLLRSIWQNPTHRQALQRESAKESFTRFANLLMNDVTYLLDDSLTQLQSVRKVEQLKANPDVWNSMTDEERKTEEDRLASNEYHCPYQLQLANENVNMLKVFTEETPNAFLKSEIVNRLAAMLDYNLDTMAGPKCQELKVSDPKKFHFQPKILLSDLLSIFLNLSGKAQFHAAIVNDGRSYRRELFERAIGIARRAGLKTDVELAKLEAMIDSVEELKRLEEEEENWDDVPDEFLGATPPASCMACADLLRRSDHVDLHEGPGHLADVEDDCRPLDYQAALSVGPDGPIQPCTAQD